MNVSLESLNLNKPVQPQAPSKPKAIPLKYLDGGLVKCDPKEATFLTVNIPGPSGKITLPVMIGGTRDGTGNWTWNGSIESPTLKPSVLTTSGHYVDKFDPEKDSCWCKYFKEHPEENPKVFCYRCHTHINDGRVQFLSDCSHDLVGKNVELLDV